MTHTHGVQCSLSYSDSYSNKKLGIFHWMKQLLNLRQEMYEPEIFNDLIPTSYSCLYFKTHH